MQNLDFQSVLAIASGMITIISAVLQVLPMLRYRLRKSFLLLSVFASGVFSCAVINLSPLFGVPITVFILFALLFISRSDALLHLLTEAPSTIVTKVALYNVFCETIQRACGVLVGENEFAGGDLRVSIFSLNWKAEKLLLVGRYPLKSPSEVPEVEFNIGHGVAGVCAETGRPNKVENLPRWEDDERTYIDRLSSEYGISEKEIRSYNRKSRSYYNFPISFRDPKEAAHRIRFVVCIDSLHKSISSGTVTSQQIQDLAVALAENNKDLLVRDVIGF